LQVIYVEFLSFKEVLCCIIERFNVVVSPVEEVANFFIWEL